MTGKNYIGNVLSSTGKITFKTFNPKTNTENETVYTEAAAAEIEAAVRLADAAFTAYSQVSGADKSAFLTAIAQEIEALGSLLIDTYCSETGLPESRALGERGRTIFQLRSFAALVAEGSWVEAAISTADATRKPLPKVSVRSMLTPLGPVVVFGASNFPLAYSTAGGDTAAALAAGCPVIVKSHPMHAGTGELIASAVIRAAEQTGMPRGVFSNLNSRGIEVGVELVKHPKVKAVGFTGSVQGGRALYDLASQRPEPIPFFAEMGSINPVVLLPEAMEKNAEKWARAYATSIALGSGQFCTNPGLILGVKGNSLDQFIAILAKELANTVPSCMLHPKIVGSYENNKKMMADHSGVNPVIKHTGDVGINEGRPAVMTVDGATFSENKNLHQEVFGPFSLVVQCTHVEALTAVLAGLEGQLTGTIIGETKEIHQYPSLISTLQQKVGRLIFNGVPTGVEVCESMVHGGPYPASTDSRFTAVGTRSIKRWLRPVSFQQWPNDLLPDALKDENPLKIHRKVDGIPTKDPISDVVS